MYTCIYGNVCMYVSIYETICNNHLIQHVNKTKSQCTFLKCVGYPVDITLQIGILKSVVLTSILMYNLCHNCGGEHWSYIAGNLPSWSLCSFFVGILYPSKNFK